MAIGNYEIDGKALFYASVDRRSKMDASIRVCKRRDGFLTAKDAKVAERELSQEAKKILDERERHGESWGQLVREWEDALYKGRGTERPVQLTTVIDNVAALDKYTSHWLARPASSITKTDVRELLFKMQDEGKSKGRQKAIKNAINGCFNWAIDYGKVRGVLLSPAAGIKIPKGEEKKPEILTLLEIRKLLEGARAYDHPWYPIWAAALHTGMRSGELHSLTWDDLDFENRKITVNKSWNARFKKVKSTKSSYWREVPINAELEVLLKQLKLQAGTRVQVFPRFTDWDRGEAARVLRQFCVGIGIKSVKFHALRACFATQLLRAGIAPVTVMRVAGWKELKTMQFYVRLSGIEIDGATDKLSFITPQEAMGKVIDLFGKED